MTVATASRTTVRRGHLHFHAGAEHRMGMPSIHIPRRWTEPEFYAARDDAPYGERWELVDGELLVTPSPNWVHQEIVGRLHLLIAPYLQEHPVGRALLSPLDVRMKPGLVMQPDLLVVPLDELKRRADVVRRLLLAIEVVSPGSARHDRVTKRPRYQRHRVPEYWVIDDSSQTAERWTPDDERPELIADRLVWHPAGAGAPLVIDLPAFFAEILPGE